MPRRKLEYAPSIRSKLMLLVLACILPAALLAVLLINYDYRLTYDNFIRSALATAHANAMEVDKELAIVESALVGIATSPHLSRGDLQAFDAQARQLSARQNIFNLVLENADGQQLVNTFRPWGVPLPREAGSASLRFLREQDRTFISSLFVGPVAQRQMVAVGIPVTARNGTWYALTATIAVERFGTILHQQHYPEHWVTSIIDRGGRIVARTVDMQRFVGTQALPQVRERMRQQSESAFETETLDGKPILAVMARAANSGWTVAIGIPLANLKDEMWRKLWSLVLVTIGLLGAGLLIAWKIGTRIRRSMHGLIAPALALGAGERVVPVSYGVRESDEVAAALVKASEMLQRTQHQASHDGLTGLANRVMFGDFLARQLAISQRSQGTLAVLYLDLDHFKTINDTHGHAVGDQLLIEASARLTSQLRKADMAARLGGDEFAVVLVDAGEAETARVVDKLDGVMAQPYRIGELQLRAGASIGVALYPQHGDDLERLLEAADQAMYQAKAARRSGGRPGAAVLPDR
ncbi:diguanylate cyclase [Duganella sp. FT80W]|uniref:Diguanylate cyclase n=1 Tax=Duganella guangzhouensis TaxID=2666084 RepID=A0A6I2KTV8_9BURK|nr:sensor domain-containing diguanylate cyclase [Duganella guangzhouensis]MRW89395.1 diguanylate cyclase [Duganella guangzhouensis]